MEKMTTNILMKLVAASFFFVVSTAEAQILVKADAASLQAQIRRDEKGFASCGVRAVVIVQSAKAVDAYDFSIMISADAQYGLIKAGKSVTPMSAVLQGKVVNEAVTPPPVSFWIAKESEGIALRSIKPLKSETKGFFLSPGDLLESVKAINSMIDGERMHFSVRYKSQPVDVVVSFSKKMPNDEAMPLFTCLQAVIDRIVKN